MITDARFCNGCGEGITNPAGSISIRSFDPKQGSLLFELWVAISPNGCRVLQNNSNSFDFHNINCLVKLLTELANQK